MSTGGTPSMDRRGFLRLGALGALSLSGAGAAFSLSSCDLLPTESDGSANRVSANAGMRPSGYADVSFGQSVDVLIIGSGIAGLSAAIEPAQAGLSVLICDKHSLLGGESFEAVGIMHVSGSDIQKKAGMKTTVDDAIASALDALPADEPHRDERKELLSALIQAKAEWVNIMDRDFGAEFQNPENYLTNDTPENILLPRAGLGNMTKVMTPLRDGLSEKGVTFRLDTQASQFIMDEQDQVAGVRFFAKESNTNIDIRAKCVILATGGFCANQQMVHTNLPGHAQIGCLTYLSDGSGIQMASRQGAQLLHMDTEDELISDIPSVGSWGLFGNVVGINPRGERFAREDEQFSQSNQCQWQGLGFFYTIFGKNLSEGVQSNSVAKTMQKYPRRVYGPFDTIDELAESLSVPAETLNNTITRYNELAKQGNDEDFHKERFLQELTGPYHAIKQFTNRFRTRGGVRTNASGAVLKKDGEPIGNLYACGACAAGFGGGLVEAGAYGLITGRAVADMLKPASNLPEANADAAASGNRSNS